MNSKQRNVSLNKSPLANHSPAKQFPSISLTKHLQDYKAYRSIDNRKKHPDIDKSMNYNNSGMIGLLSPDQKSINVGFKNSQMPSIHVNQNQYLNQGTKVQKLQQKIYNLLQNNRKAQQWKLYMTKSQLIYQRTDQHQEIQAYLLKFILKTTGKQVVHNQGQQLINDGQNVVSFQAQCNKTFNESMSFQRNSPQPSLKILRQQHQNLQQNLYQTLIQQVGINSLNKTSTNFNNTINMNSNNQFNLKTLNKTNNQQQIYSQQINKLIFDQSVMQKKVHMYQKRIFQLQYILKQANISFDHQDHKINKIQSNQNQDYIQKMVDQNRYKNQADIKKMQNQSLHRQLDMMKDFSLKMKSQNQKLSQQCQKLIEQNIKYKQYLKFKQLWLLSSQQTHNWKCQTFQKRQQIKKQANKIKILQQKNKQLLHSFNFSMVVNPDQQQDKQQLQSIIKSFQDWLRVISVPRVNPASIDPRKLLQSNNVQENQTMPDPENMNYRLLKPNFFIYFQSYEKTIMMQKNILNTRPLEPTFFVKIRAILDAMYNHFNCYNTYKYWINFPQFVIGFLQKYEINYISHKVEPRKKSLPSEEKLTFLMNLFNKKISNTWQCQIFRSFILQEYTLDQIYFFLDCRNHLNGGNTLTHGMGNSDMISYVKLHKALSTTQTKLVPYQNVVIQKVKNILKSRKKTKNNQAYIDRYFVLKILLQVYSLQKGKSQKIFEATFKTKGKKQAITYLEYYGFMSKNFQFLSSIQICELYRQIYAMSSGKITHKAIHYMCTSKGLFIPLIWAKRLNMNVLEKSFNNDMMLLDIQNNAGKISSLVSSAGVQSIGKLQLDLNYFVRQLDWYRNNRQFFYFKLQEQKMKIIRANSLLDWQASTYSPTQMLSSQQIREAILKLHGLIHQSDPSIKLLLSAKQSKQKAIRLITRNFKIRIQQSIREFQKVDQQQILKLKKQMGEQIKMRQSKLKDKNTTLKNSGFRESFLQKNLKVDS